MKESYDEGVANHIGPESCAFVREDRGEALTGVRAGRVWSREIPKSRVLTLYYGWKAKLGVSIWRDTFGPCAVRDPESGIAGSDQTNCGNLQQNALKTKPFLSLKLHFSG